MCNVCIVSALKEKKKEKPPSEKKENFSERERTSRGERTRKNCVCVYVRERDIQEKSSKDIKKLNLST